MLFYLSTPVSWSRSSSDISIQILLDKYEEQYSEYQESNTRLQSLIADIQSSETRLNALAKEKINASDTLENLQRIDRENPALGLSDKVKESRERNRKSHELFSNETDNLNELKSQQISFKNDVKGKIHLLNSIRGEIQQVQQNLVAAKAQSQIERFNKTTTVEGYAEVGCGDESPRQCQSRAKRNAERNATEKGSVVLVDAATNIVDFELAQDDIKTEVQAQLSNVEVLKRGWVGDTSYMFRIRADVTPIISNNMRHKIEVSIASSLDFDVPPKLQVESGQNKHITKVSNREISTTRQANVLQEKNESTDSSIRNEVEDSNQDIPPTKQDSLSLGEFLFGQDTPPPDDKSKITNNKNEQKSESKSPPSVGEWLFGK